MPSRSFDTALRDILHHIELAANFSAGFDRATREAWWWIADARDLAWWEAAAPLRIVLHWWAVAEGCRLIHAGAADKESVA